MKIVRKVIGWYFIISGYVGGAITLIYGVFSAIGGVFDWRLFLLGLFGAMLIYTAGLFIKEGRKMFKIDQVELERLKKERANKRERTL